MSKLYKFISAVLAAACLSCSAPVFAEPILIADTETAASPTPIPIPSATKAPILIPDAAPSASPAAAETDTPASAVPAFDDPAARTPIPIPPPEPEPIFTEPTADYVRIQFDTYGELLIPGTAVFELYTMDDTLLGTWETPLMENTKSFDVWFALADFRGGEQFKLKFTSGLQSMQYYDTILYAGNFAVLDTYSFIPEGETQGIVNSTFHMTAYPYLEKKVNLYMNQKPLVYTPRARMINGTLMVPVVQACKSLGISDVTYDANYNSVRVAIKNKEVLFNIGTAYTTVLGKDQYLPVPTQIIDGSTYVPLRTLAESFHCPIAVVDHGSYLDVAIAYSKDAYNYSDKTQYVNAANLTSQTNYLIWISKAHYEVNVFEKKNGTWSFLKSFACAIGTNETPTCVGTYRYYEKISRWTYPDFYVGPVMRFNGGYAIHSTLLKYDGTNYNSTVGKKLSHGCVRVKPANMNWLIDTIPMYTTVHVTNE